MSTEAIATISSPVGIAGASADRFERPRNVEQAARAFESLFLEQLLSEMRRGVPEGGLFKRGFAEKTFQQMLDRSYAGHMADRGGVGLSALLLRSWGVVEEGTAPTADGLGDTDGPIGEAAALPDAALVSADEAPLAAPERADEEK